MQEEHIKNDEAVEAVESTEEERSVLKPIYETRSEREVRIMNECRNSPHDVEEVQASEKVNTSADSARATIKGSVGFKVTEGAIAATSWPAAIIAVCFMAIWVIIGACELTALISAGLILVLTVLGCATKNIRYPKFALDQDEYKRHGNTKVKYDPDPNNYKTIAKVHRRYLRSGEYAHVLSSIMLVVAFVLLTVFMPIEVSYFVAMALVFAIFWALGSEFVSSSTPYCDVYDIDLEDGQKVVAVSFDTPMPNETRYFTQIDGDRAYILALRQTTKDFLKEEASMFKLNSKGTISRK